MWYVECHDFFDEEIPIRPDGHAFFSVWVERRQNRRVYREERKPLNNSSADLVSPDDLDELENKLVEIGIPSGPAPAALKDMYRRGRYISESIEDIEETIGANLPSIGDPIENFYDVMNRLEKIISTKQLFYSIAQQFESVKKERAENRKKIISSAAGRNRKRANEKNRRRFLEHF